MAGIEEKEKEEEPINPETMNAFVEEYNNLCERTGLGIGAIPILIPGQGGWKIGVQMQIIKMPSKPEKS